MDKINLLQKFDLIAEHWSPKIIGELNGQQVKLVKFQGEFAGITMSRKTKRSW